MNINLTLEAVMNHLIAMDESKRAEYVREIEIENEHMRTLLADIERTIDKSIVLFAYEQPDFQQISVAIKRLRTQLGTKAMKAGTLTPGLERR